MSSAPSSAEAPRLAGVELGGTKAIAVLADGHRIIDRLVVPTTMPHETLGAMSEKLAQWNSERALSALGIASFGPVRLAPDASDYGRILATPKPGWTGASVTVPFADRFAVPIGLDTDVNAAALAEYRWGAGRGCDSLVYITIGTGIGGGVVIGGRSLKGRLHPELGHILSRRSAGDEFAGICPYHGDCAEGLFSGPALAARFGEPAEGVAADDPRWAAPAANLAQLVAVLIEGFAPNRILIGGGVGLGARQLVELALAEVPAILGGYFPDLDAAALRAMVIAPALGADAGPLGAIALAEDAMTA